MIISGIKVCQFFCNPLCTPNIPPEDLTQLICSCQGPWEGMATTPKEEQNVVCVTGNGKGPENEEQEAQGVQTTAAASAAANQQQRPQFGKAPPPPSLESLLIPQTPTTNSSSQDSANSVTTVSSQTEQCSNNNCGGGKAFLISPMPGRRISLPVMPITFPSAAGVTSPVPPSSPNSSSRFRRPSLPLPTTNLVTSSAATNQTSNSKPNNKMNHHQPHHQQQQHPGGNSSNFIQASMNPISNPQDAPTIETLNAAKFLSSSSSSSSSLPTTTSDDTNSSLAANSVVLTVPPVSNSVSPGRSGQANSLNSMNFSSYNLQVPPVPAGNNQRLMRRGNLLQPRIPNSPHTGPWHGRFSESSLSALQVLLPPDHITSENPNPNLNPRPSFFFEGSSSSMPQVKNSEAPPQFIPILEQSKT
jgi:hypothetical protein